VATAIALNTTIDGAGGETKLTRIIGNIAFKEPGRRIDSVGELRDEVRILLEVVAVTIDVAGAAVSLVVVAPRQLNKTTAIIGFAGGSNRTIRALLVVKASGLRASRGSKFFIVKVAARLPDGLSNKCDLAIERVAFRHIIDGVYKILGSTLGASLKLVVAVQTNLEVGHRQCTSRRSDAAATRRRGRRRAGASRSAMSRRGAAPSILRAALTVRAHSIAT